MINELLDNVQKRLSDFIYGTLNFSWFPEIFIWYWYLFLLFLLCGVIIWFFGWSKIVRIVASMGFLFAAVFVAGGYVMARRMEAKKAFAEAREKQRQAERKRRERTQQPHEPWRFPWS